MIRSVQVGDVILSSNRDNSELVIAVSPSHVWYALPSIPYGDILGAYYLYEGGKWVKYHSPEQLMEGDYLQQWNGDFKVNTPAPYHKHSVKKGDMFRSTLTQHIEEITNVDHDYVWINDNREDCISFYDLNRMYEKV